jgi:hypothetical protein
MMTLLSVEMNQPAEINDRTRIRGKPAITELKSYDKETAGLESDGRSAQHAEVIQLPRSGLVQRSL